MEETTLLEEILLPPINYTNGTFKFKWNRKL